MALPKVIYNTGAGGDVTLQFAGGPQDFTPRWAWRGARNVATSGLVESVEQGRDILIGFAMPAMTLTEVASWAALMGWMLGGGQADLYPDASLSEHYHVVSEDQGFEPKRVGPGRYAASFAWRIVPDDHAPAGPDVVLKRFYGIAV